MADERKLGEGPEQKSSGDLAARAQASRRQLLRAGAVGAPFLLTLKSGTAWAASFCEDNFDEAPNSYPDAATINTAIDAADSRTLILTMTSFPDDAAIDSAIAATVDDSNFDVDQPSDVLYALITAGSCWDSFCDAPIASGRPPAATGVDGCS